VNICGTERTFVPAARAHHLQGSDWDAECPRITDAASKSSCIVLDSDRRYRVQACGQLSPIGTRQESIFGNYQRCCTTTTDTRELAKELSQQNITIEKDGERFDMTINTAYVGPRHLIFPYSVIGNNDKPSLSMNSTPIFKGLSVDMTDSLTALHNARLA